jgi:hypothetical protein
LLLVAAVSKGLVTDEEAKDQLQTLRARLTNTEARLALVSTGPAPGADRATLARLLRGTVNEYAAQLRADPEAARMVLRALLPEPIVVPRQDGTKPEPDHIKHGSTPEARALAQRAIEEWQRRGLLTFKARLVLPDGTR